MSVLKLETCPLKAAGLRLERFVELGTLVIGQDDRCICTTNTPCIDRHKRGEVRCTITELKALDYQAVSRRAYQSGAWDE